MRAFKCETCHGMSVMVLLIAAKKQLNIYFHFASFPFQMSLTALDLNQEHNLKIEAMPLLLADKNMLKLERN